MLFLKNFYKYKTFKVNSEYLNIRQVKNLQIPIYALYKAYTPKIDENLIKSKAVVDLELVKEYEKIHRKMCTNGFMIFNGETIKEKIKQNPGQPISILTKSIAAEWRTFPYEKKLAYFQKAHEKSEYFKDQLRELVKDLSEPELKNLRLQLIEHKKKKSEKKNKNRLKQEKFKLGMPRKPLSAINLFQKELNLEKFPFHQKGKELGNRWKQLTEDEKMSFKAKAKELKNDYLKKLHEWELNMVTIGKADLVSEKAKKKLIETFGIKK